MNSEVKLVEAVTDSVLTTSVLPCTRTYSRASVAGRRVKSRVVVAAGERVTSVYSMVAKEASEAATR